MRRRWTWGLAGLVGLSCASEPGSPAVPSSRIRDSTGAEFGWECDPEGCRVERVEESPALPSCAEGLTPVFEPNAERFFMVRATCRVDEGEDELVDERIVACDEDAPCPRGDDYECRAGLCQSADHQRYPPEDVPTWGEIFRLCRAESAWYSTLEPGLFDRIDAVCPEGREASCDRVPAECRQP